MEKITFIFAIFQKKIQKWKNYSRNFSEVHAEIRFIKNTHKKNQRDWMKSLAPGCSKLTPTLPFFENSFLQKKIMKATLKYFLSNFNTFIIKNIHLTTSVQKIKTFQWKTAWESKKMCEYPFKLVLPP